MACFVDIKSNQCCIWGISVAFVMGRNVQFDRESNNAA